MPLSLPGILFSIFSAYLKSYSSFKASHLISINHSRSVISKWLKIVSYFYKNVCNFMNILSKYFTMILCKNVGGKLSKVKEIRSVCMSGTDYNFFKGWAELTEKRFKQKLEGGKGASHVVIWERASKAEEQLEGRHMPGIFKEYPRGQMWPRGNEHGREYVRCKGVRVYGAS